MTSKGLKSSEREVYKAQPTLSPKMYFPLDGRLELEFPRSVTFSSVLQGTGLQTGTETLKTVNQSKYFLLQAVLSVILVTSTPK